MTPRGDAHAAILSACRKFDTAFEERASTAGRLEKDIVFHNWMAEIRMDLRLALGLSRTDPLPAHIDGPGAPE